MHSRVRAGTVSRQLAFKFAPALPHCRPGERICIVMDQTPEQLLGDIAAHLAKALPMQGGIYSLADATSDCGLVDCWSSASVLDHESAVRTVLRAAYGRSPQLLVDLVSVIVRFGSRRFRNN